MSWTVLATNSKDAIDNEKRGWNELCAYRRDKLWNHTYEKPAVISPSIGDDSNARVDLSSHPELLQRSRKVEVEVKTWCFAQSKAPRATRNASLVR